MSKYKIFDGNESLIDDRTFWLKHRSSIYYEKDVGEEKTSKSSGQHAPSEDPRVSPLSRVKSGANHQGPEGPFWESGANSLVPTGHSFGGGGCGGPTGPILQGGGCPCCRGPTLALV